ncbi:MAG: hypothetical protein MK137_02200 [Rickettsiales bacterium]|nr:hypothetical protein [Rickettsiales bacterium]
MKENNNLYQLKIQALNQALIRTSIIALVIVLVLIAGCVGAYLYYASKEKELKGIQGKMISKQGQLISLRQKKEDYEDSLRLWESLSSKNKELKGIKVDKGREILEILRQKYDVNNLNINFTIPEIVQSRNWETETIDVVSSTVTLTFEAISDQYAMSFVDAVKKELPGYVKILSLRINKLDGINEQVIIQASRGEFPSLVKARLQFLWRDLKEKESDLPIPESLLGGSS